MTDKHYILKDKQIIETDLMSWAEWFETAKEDRIVKQETLTNGNQVSTVFLGIDHNFKEGPPLLFETMVFPKKGDSELDMKRYSTYEEAEEGHKKMVKKYEFE